MPIPSHAHVIFHMSLTHWVNFELKIYAQFLLQCLASSPSMEPMKIISNPIFSILVSALLLECSSIEIQSPNVIHERGFLLKIIIFIKYNSLRAFTLFCCCGRFLMPFSLQNYCTAQLHIASFHFMLFSQKLHDLVSLAC